MVRECLYNILAVFVGFGILSSCQDEPIMQGSGHIPEGNATISASVSYKPFGSTLGGDSRAATAGDAIKDINTLYVLLYNEEGILETMFNAKTETENYIDETHNYTIPETVQPGSEHIAESSGICAKFKKVVPYGNYKIYAVANVDLSVDKYSASINTESGLKSISFNWDASNIGNNNQMFGFFYHKKVVSKPTGFDAPLVTIASPNVNLHAWIRRLASKVTIAYDGTNLNENVSIYIHSAQIKDIPKQCLLGSSNAPKNEDKLTEGASISYRTSEESNLNTAGIKITTGNPKGGSDHSETSDALFFYENMQGSTTAEKGKFQDETEQGTVTHPEGNNPEDPDYKDGITYGSYIEVKGYYVNKNPGNASVGEITYRFMLGKDAIRDCNAERNYHYKLTLKFKNDANNPDWHIVYEPENPTISVPTPLYISYGYNESINIPVVVRGASVDANTTIKATITENPWGYPAHKYYKKSKHDGLEDGFLIFASPESAPIKITETERNTDWPKDGYGQWNAVKPTNVDETVARYDIPVYTRSLILGNSLTGHNPYVSYERKAKVKFEVTLDGESIKKEIEVIQVKRLVNPTGVWRSNSNTTPFNVRLMELNEPDTGEAGMIHRDFYAPTSDGPWTAHIEKGASWVRIAETDTNDWGTDDVVGGTGSEIRFDYKPVGENTTGNVRCGVIKVTYHNNNCVHYVFVSQGNGTVNLKGTKWQNRNVQAQYQLVDNPLMEGSMFKFGNPWYGILVENNYRDGYGFDQDCWGKTFVTTHNREEIRFDGNGGIGYKLETGFTGDRSIYDNTARPASYEEWKALEDLPRRYGVLYGDECTETMTTTTDAYSYWEVNQMRGMQGMFVWDNTVGKDGNHIFFPIGSTGYGHRKVNDNAYLSTYGEIDKYSLLKYAQRPLEMPETTAELVPMYYDLYIRKGAIYWYNEMFEGAVDNDGVTSNGYGHDINFHTMLLQTYGANAVGQSEKKETDDDDAYISTDACYIRCVEP